MKEPTPGRVLRWVRRLLAVLISLCALTGMLRLVLPATAATGEPPGVYRQLAFIRAALEDGAAEEAQRLFPEGYFFSHVLYGLAWIELGEREPGHRREAPASARWALDRLESPAGREPFDPALTPAHGVFYRGWINWLRGGLLKLQQPQERDPDQVRRFAADSAEIAQAFRASATPYLEAYPGQAWPVDSTVAIASLRLHDSLLTPRFGDTVARWLGQVRRGLDPATGLIPHRVDAATGEALEGARGSSQALINRFLIDVDPAFAREQYLRFRDRFLAFPLGLGPAVREYPHGTDGPADVDSGPLLLGVSLSATVVTLGAAQAHGDHTLAAALANYGELAGLPVDTPSTKRYAFGLLPIGDAFLAWSKTAQPWVAEAPSSPPEAVSSWWRVPLLVLLAVIGAAPWVPAMLRLRSRGRAAVRTVPDTA